MSLEEKLFRTFTKEEYKNFDKNGTVMKITIGIVLLSLVITLLVFGVGYYRDDIKTPAADEHSVPADTN